MRIRLFIQRFVKDEISDELGVDRYPLFSALSKVEVGPATSDDWTVRYYDMFLFRRAVGIEVRR